MNAQIFLSRTDLESGLPPGYVKQAQLLRLALIAGVVVFYLMILIISFTGDFPPDSNGDVLPVLSAAHGFFTLAAFAGSMVMLRRVLSRERLLGTSTTADRQDIVRRAFSAYAVAGLIRMAILEGAAFMGGATCLTAVTSGVMSEQPLYWLNSLSALLQITVGLATFPTRETILTTLDDLLCRP